ncbi:hypothetical protein GOEFS_063_00300 [Gordonia effusa NBRC 100432]|uniref:DUF1772 domain-containing protein n=1 Tax=Gordonia effusa NBRC 100432 TaxID=1077974 RepID=H0R105_9ACTN|nr:anthrone oxygenase family protein [Gordonia effusa]GAB18756.1 hypothetical protein GOEFS_063_00300 [Gordonia effusa NBRC 100432]
MTFLRSLVLLAAVLCSGLMAGLFAAFAYSVMPALARADASSSIAVMQRINAAILNPIFGLIFGGGLIVSALATAVSWNTNLRWWTLAALGCYLLGTLITVAFNVPLNNQLDAAGVPSVQETAAVWTDFATSWVRCNIARTVAHLGGFAVLVLGLITTRPSA